MLFLFTYIEQGETKKVFSSTSVMKRPCDKNLDKYKKLFSNRDKKLIDMRLIAEVIL